MVGVSEDRSTPERDPDDRPAGTGKQPRQRLRLLLAVAATLFVLDLVTKIAVVEYIRPGESVSVIGDVVELVLVRNPGAAFSMATGMTWLLTLIATAGLLWLAARSFGVMGTTRPSEAVPLRQGQRDRPVA